MITTLDAGALMRKRTDRFLECVGGMTGEQWLYRPTEGGWSVSEVTEHVATANRGVLVRIRNGTADSSSGTSYSPTSRTRKREPADICRSAGVPVTYRIAPLSGVVNAPLGVRSG